MSKTNLNLKSGQLPIIIGCEGTSLTAAEKDFYKQVQPLGFILVGRNCESAQQVTALVQELKDAVGHDKLMLLIDHEGGRVQRLRPPHARHAPTAASFGELWNANPEQAKEMVALNARLIAYEVKQWGFNVNCVPELDVRHADTHDVIGDRSYGFDPEVVAALGRVMGEEMMKAGIWPTIKHIPGHGRAMVDSHFDLPLIDATQEELISIDFRPFVDLNDFPIAMTAHLKLNTYDEAEPVTFSKTVIDKVIRGHMDFKGLIMTDDLDMKALAGSMSEKVKKSHAAGCDILLQCNGNMSDMKELVDVAEPLTATRAQQFDDILALPEPKVIDSKDYAGLLEQLESVVKAAA